MRTASCSCGQLSVTLSGEPARILVCHCTDCQKATGSPFGVSTYWPKSAVVEMKGESRSFTRVSARGRSFTHHFCPHCGGRLFWYGEFAPEAIGVAYGNFDEATLPGPTDEYWTKRKHPWVSFACEVKTHP